MEALSHYDITMSDVVGSAAFLLTAVALLLTSMAIAFSVWANYRTRRLEAETIRLELSYRLMLAAAGGGDARLQSHATHYSSMEVQISAIAALRAYPENVEIYKRLLNERTVSLLANPDDSFTIRLRDETKNLIDSILNKKLQH